MSKVNITPNGEHQIIGPDRSRPITDFLTRASKFCRRITNVKTPIGEYPEIVQSISAIALIFLHRVITRRVICVKTPFGSRWVRRALHIAL